MEGVWPAGRRFEALKWEKHFKSKFVKKKRFQLNSGTRLERFLARIYDLCAFKLMIFPFLTLELQVTPSRRPEKCGSPGTGQTRRVQSLGNENAEPRVAASFPRP